MVRAIPHLQVGMIYRQPESCASRDHDVYRIYVVSLHSRHVSCYRILIVKPLSHVITSISYGPLFVVTVSLICACSTALVIYNNLGNLEAVTFIFIFSLINRTSQPIKNSCKQATVSRTSIKHNAEMRIETKQRENSKHYIYKLYERSNQKIKHIQAIDVQIKILSLTSGASIWPKLDLTDGT